MTVDGSFVPVSAESVASVALDGETVLLHVGSGALRHLDAIGAVVWACFDGASTIDEIAADLGAEFGVNRDRVRHDVIRLVQTLQSDGLLRRVAPGATDASPFDHGGTLPTAEIPAGGPRLLIEPPSS